MEEDLKQQAQILAETLHATGAELLHHHIDTPEIPITPLQGKLEIFQNFLQGEYPGIRLLLLHVCENNDLLRVQTGPVTDNPEQMWSKAISEGSFGTHKTKEGLSLLHPLYALDSKCDQMAACVFYPKSAKTSSLPPKPLLRNLIYASGYTLILLLVHLKLYLNRKHGNAQRRDALVISSGVFFCSLLFSVQVADFANQIEIQTRLRAFENYAASVTSRLSTGLMEIQDQTLKQLVAFVEASEEVTEQEFQRFTRDLNRKHPDVTLYWILNTENPPAVAYFSGRAPEGISLDEDEVSQEVLRVAAAAGEARANEVHQSHIHSKPGIFIAHPVAGPDASTKGWIGYSLILESLIQSSLRYGSLNPDTLKLKLQALSEAQSSPPAKDAFIRPVFAFGKSYLVSATPNQKYWTLYPIRLGLWLGGAGSLLSLMVSLLVFENLNRNQRLEEKVRDRTESLDQLLQKHLNITNNLPVGLALCNGEHITEMNPRLKAWFGDSVDLCNQLKPQLISTLSEDGKFSDLIPLETRFGKREMKCTALTMPDGGNNQQILILLEDWTEQLRSEQALKDKTAELERLFNSSTDLLCISTLDGTFLNLNPQWEQTLGYSTVEMTGQNWLAYIHPSDLKEAGSFLERICEKDETQNRILRFKPKHNGEIWLDWKATREGNLIHATVRDISERVEAENRNRAMREHVARAQKMESIGRLAGGIAHDFNNSLQVIIGNAQLVLTQPDLTEMQQGQLRDVLKAADRSAQLIRQLLGFAMKQHVQAAPTDLNRKLKDMSPIFEALLGDRIQLEWRLDPELANVKMDSGQLEQICISLLENCRDALPRGGNVTIVTENRDYTESLPDDLMIDVKPGHYVSFSVRDNGTGISPDLLPNLFEPFTTSQDASQGSGLGLATVYGILQQNKGSIRVKSQLRTGTRMEILLPRLQGIRPPQPRTHNQSDIKGKILVVDDNLQILQLSKQVLRDLNYPVIPIGSPAVALEYLEEDPDICLLVTDVLMPKISGQELYEKALILRPELKCIFMSGYSSDVVDPEFLKPGKCIFLHKPFSLDSIHQAVSDLLSATG